MKIVLKKVFFRLCNQGVINKGIVCHVLSKDPFAKVNKTRNKKLISVYVVIL